MRTALAILAAACAFAQSGIERPHLGQMLDSHGQVWPVYGVPGSFLLIKPQARGVISMACSPLLCAAKTETGLLINGLTVEAPRGPAMIAPNGADAWLYFPITRAFAQWHDGKLTPLAVRVDGQVLALGQGFTIAVRRPNGVWILSRDSAILDSLPPETANVLLLPGATIFSTSDSLVLRRPGSNDLTFPAPGISALYQMGGALVEARAGSILYALDITPGSERLFQLPQPSRDTRR